MGNVGEEPLNLSSKGAISGSDILLDPDLAMECMQFTMGYYITLSRIINRKFEHAQKAIQKRLQEMQSEQKDLKSELKSSPAPLEKIKKYKALGKALSQLNEALEIAQLSVEDLEQIHEIFGMLPGKVKVYFDILVNLDHELVEMTKEISSKEYMSAYIRAQKIIDMVQDGKDALSGKAVADDRTLHYDLNNVLQPLKKELSNMRSKRDGYAVLPDGKLIRDL